ncbi:MAG: phosphodiester glycosidase family protein [Gammaproteobacteria bacterium]|nr:phosphodiester glycosidase family protein [Gammaproteobacteria bacterium]
MWAFFCILWIFFTTPAFSEQTWQLISPGIEYQDRQNFLAPWSHVHVFRIQLTKNKLSLARARELGFKQAFVKDLAESVHAIIGINGGFFDPQFRPLGLRIHESQQLSSLKHISWWSVFYIQDGKAYIKRAHQVLPQQNNVHFAIQSGPRLLVAGHIPASLKLGRDERTALGITRDGSVVVVVTENALLTTPELAEIMKAPPILAVDALNLDGGSSTQLYVNLPSLHLDLRGFSMVADAVLVKPT